MTNFIPIYPLNIIVFPDEVLNLQIVEPRYQELIRVCFADNKHLGLPVQHTDKAMEYGTLVAITEVNAPADEQPMTIQVKGLQVFRILEIINTVPGKMYSGAIVTYPENDKIKVHHRTATLIYSEVKRFYSMLHLEQKTPRQDKDWISYDLAHKLGLDKEQEYELLCIFNEVQRMEFLRRHLKSIVATSGNLEILKSRINLN